MRIFLSIILLAAIACGDDAPVKKSRAGLPTTAGAPAAPRAGKGDKGAPAVLSIKAKVPADYRRDFKSEDFASDATGEINRDPFYSYLVAPASAGTAANPNQATPIKDECENRMVAGKATFRDLKLVGIILRGTKNFAMFTDRVGVGWTVFIDDCLSKDKARVVEITQGCVKLEVRGGSPSGSRRAPPTGGAHLPPSG